jgi:hypothetical protein
MRSFSGTSTVIPDVPCLEAVPLPVRDNALAAAVRDACRLLSGRPPDLLLINDPQRGTATTAVLRAMRAGLDVCGVRIVVAAGSHRFAAAVRSDFERSVFGDLRPAACDWHDALRPDLAPVAAGPEGWRGHPWLAEARRVLAIGSVEPHYFAGFTGAHKTLTIGCAAYPDIERNHEAALQPACRPCRTAGNPVHEGIARMLATLAAGRCLAAVNLVQDGDTILDAAGGEPLASLDALATRVRAACLRTIPRPADGLIAEVTGALACSFYQAEKGIKNVEWAVRNGGAIVLAADCPEGVGQDAFLDLLSRAPTHAAAVATVRGRGYRLGDHKAVRLRYLTDPACRGMRLFAVCPGLEDGRAAILGVRKAASVADATRLAGLNPASDTVYRIRDAGNLCVEVEAGLGITPQKLP